MSYELQSVERAIELLDQLAAGRGLRLTELSTAMGANPTTVLRTLRVLTKAGFVRRDPRTQAYLLGTRLAELGNVALRNIDTTQVLRPWTSELSARCNVTAHVGMLRGNGVTIVDKVDPPRPLVRYSFLGTQMPLHATAAGKAVLALCGEELLDGAALPLPAYTVHSICDLHVLREDLEATRRRRYSMEKEEYQIGFGCVGTAFRLGEDVFAVSLSGATPDVAVLDRHGEMLRSAIDDFLGQHVGAAVGFPVEW